MIGYLCKQALEFAGWCWWCVTRPSRPRRLCAWCSHALRMPMDERERLTVDTCDRCGKDRTVMMTQAHALDQDEGLHACGGFYHPDKEPTR